jgi:hypothetical protein
VAGGQVRVVCAMTGCAAPGRESLSGPEEFPKSFRNG